MKATEKNYYFDLADMGTDFGSYELELFGVLNNGREVGITAEIYWDGYSTGNDGDYFNEPEYEYTLLSFDVEITAMDDDNNEEFNAEEQKEIIEFVKDHISEKPTNIYFN